MLQPYMSCSTSSPGAVNVSATRSSTTSTTPSGAAIRRIVASTGTGSDMSWTHSNAATRSKRPSAVAASAQWNRTRSDTPASTAFCRAMSMDGASTS